MKKLLLPIMLLFFILSGYSQFGVNVGYSSLKYKISSSGFDMGTPGVSGVTFGVNYLSELSEKTKLGLNLNYSSFSSDGESQGQVGIPVYVQYYTSDSGSGFFLKGGAAYNIITGEVDSEMKKGSLGLVFGLGTNIGENIVIGADYNMGMSNLIKGGDVDGTLKQNIISFGVNYMF
ncbi:MAG: outer membrane beta-barrel protein [Flavobacteriales bacterium]